MQAFLTYLVMQTEQKQTTPWVAGRHRPPVIRKVPPLQALSWIRQGWRLFIAQPGQWLKMSAGVFAILVLALSFTPIPIIGPMIPLLMLTLLLGGMMFATQRQLDKRPVRFRHLFEGFRRHPGNLSLIAVFYALPLVLMHLLTMLALGGSLLVGLLGWSVGTAVNEVAYDIVEFLAGLGVLWILFLLLWGILLLAMLFAPVLVMLDNYPPFDAMRYSLKASLRSLGAIVLLSLCFYLIFVVVLIPPMSLAWVYLPVQYLAILILVLAPLSLLGVLAYIPVMVGSIYAAYADLLADLIKREPVEQGQD